MNVKLKITTAISVGILEAFLLVHLITSRSSTYMDLYNLGTFLLIFFGGAIAFTIANFIFKKLRKRTFSKEEFLSSLSFSFVSMNIVLVLFGLTFCDYSSPRDVSFLEEYQNNYSTPKKIDDGWEVSSLNEVRIDTNTYNTIINKLVNNKKYKWMHSILITRNGKLVAEDYFYEFDRNTPHDLRSANKTITSILMGIAIDKGYIENEDVTVHNFFPEHENNINWGENKNTLTIKHLLTMSAGLDCNDWAHDSEGNENKLYKTDDWIKAFLELPYKEQSGKSFSYCTFGEILCRAIIVKTSGMSLQDFANEFLFQPLQMNAYEWTMFVPTNKDIGVRVSLTPRDFAKLGQLYLNHGKWNGLQIVSEEWVEKSILTHAETNVSRLNNPKYGYLWWKSSFKINGIIIESYQAQGNGGQLCFVFPTLDMVISFTSGNYNNPRMLNAFRILEEDLLPNLIE